MGKWSHKLCRHILVVFECVAQGTCIITMVYCSKCKILFIFQILLKILAYINKIMVLIIND